MLRAILALLFAILYLIIGIPVLFVEWIIGKFNRQAADISQLRMVQWAFRVICLSVAPDLPLSEKKMFQKTTSLFSILAITGVISISSSPTHAVRA